MKTYRTAPGAACWSPWRQLSVRRSVVLGLLTLIGMAVAELALSLHATSSAAFMLRRAETSYRQLTAYQALSIEMLEYIVADQARSYPAGWAQKQRDKVEQSLADLDALTAFEAGLVRANGSDEDNGSERERIGRLRSSVKSVIAPNGLHGADQAADVSSYQSAFKPMIQDAISEELTEIGQVEQSMREMQATMRVWGRFGVLAQIVTVALMLGLVMRCVLDPISRLVADIREFGRGHLTHRVDISRHDEFGLLGQHINRMARHLERGRHMLVASNANLETTVADRTRELQARNDELREIDESRRRFFADVSHELRTPLTAIIGEADVTLRHSDGSANAAREALGSILANSTYLNRRIDDLMALARSSDGQVELASEIVDLNAVARDAIAEIRSLARINSVVTVFEPSSAPILVEGDQARLRQCLMILLDNAVKFSRAHQAVEVLLRQRDTHADVMVADLGKGIPAEELPRVFERFYQTEVGRRMGGTGLGLSIAKRIVEAHRGTIAAASNALGGTAVTITFPLVGVGA